MQCFVSRGKLKRSLFLSCILVGFIFHNFSFSEKAGLLLFYETYDNSKESTLNVGLNESNFQYDSTYFRNANKDISEGLISEKEQIESTIADSGVGVSYYQEETPIASSYCTVAYSDVSSDQTVQNGYATHKEKSPDGSVSQQEKDSFDESTPIDIFPSSDERTSGRADVASQLSPSYNRENSDEFRLETASQDISFASNIFRLILSLAFVVGLAYIVIHFMRRGRLFSTNDDPYIKIVANFNIEQGKTIKVVTIGDKAYVIGVAGNGITKIGDLDDQVIIDAMKLKAEEVAEYDGSSFAKIFSNFFSNKKKENVRSASTSVNGGSGKTSFNESLNDNLFKSQQDRLKNINIKGERNGGEE